MACPVGQPPRVRHSANRSGPAARWMAPSTPPPPRRELLAALTMASTRRVVMSAWRARSVAVMTSVFLIRQRLGNLEAELGPLPVLAPGVHASPVQVHDT